MLSTGPVVKHPTVGCIEIDLAHLCGQAECQVLLSLILLDAWNVILAATSLKWYNKTTYRHDVQRGTEEVTRSKMLWWLANRRRSSAQDVGASPGFM